MSRVLVTVEEPYAMDFGDGGHYEWLREHLTPVELRRYGRYVRAAWRLRHVPGVRALARRAAARIEGRASARSGEDPPQPTWKIRHDFGAEA